MTQNGSETVASTESTARNNGAIAAGNPAMQAAVNQAARGATHGVHVDESLRAPVVASQEEIVLAEQLRLELKRKYLNEPR